LFDAEQLEKARSAVHLLDRLRIVLVVLVFVFLGAALTLSGNRRRSLIRWGIGIVVAMGITAGLLALGRAIYLGHAQNHDAAAAAFDIIVRNLRNGIRVIALLGIIVALAAFLSGPSRVAARIRQGSRDLIGGLGRKADEAGWDAGPVGVWVGAHKMALRVAGVAVALLVLFYLNQPTPLSLLVLVLLLLVYLAAIEFLGRTPVNASANGSGNANAGGGGKPTDGTS
jgi:asparagine N-glycosylation enzyme membrane subunit Stt3